MIANSVKPSCLIVDFCGNAGRHKLVSSADILGGNISDDVAEAVAAKIRENGGKPVDVSEAIQQEMDLREQRRKEDAARRAELRIKANFLISNIDPFNEWDLTPVVERGWDRHRHFTPKQEMVLMQRIGVDPKKIPYGQGKQLLDEYFRRMQAGYASLKQTRCLRKWGIRAPMRFDETRRLMDRRLNH